ncbi:MAG: hypothetical protein HY651_12430 [Acidobacteria bacterium]|nr:hypothetical protein [Acidobacteriota bacterium]
MTKKLWFESCRDASFHDRPGFARLTLAQSETSPFESSGRTLEDKSSWMAAVQPLINPSSLRIATLLAILTATAGVLVFLVPSGPLSEIYASTLILGLLAGLHGASYGAYKDSPFESFLPRRFVRELAIAALVALTLAKFHLADSESPFVLFVSIFALTRIISEFWKLFVRIEPQEDYRIPTQFHCVTGVVHHPLLRLLAGAGFLGAIYGAYCLSKLLPRDFPLEITGAIVGGGFGLVEAIAGAYKDGSMEGFFFRKFLKSPTFGAIGGFLASWHTQSLIFLLLAAYGSCRMFLELFFKMIRRDYSPGKFSTTAGNFRTWALRRKYFLVPYVATWLIYLAMLSR